jgi:uncharacterized protein YwgA
MVVTKSVHILGGLLKRIGQITMRTFDDRLKVQKRVYLLQNFGVYLGYAFSWYLRGPYCTSLAKDVFSLVEEGIEIPDVSFEDVEDEKKFELFMNFLGDKKDDAVWLEMLASIHFLRKAYPEKSKEEIIQTVMEKEPCLKDLQKCKDAWTHLERFKLM